MLTYADETHQYRWDGVPVPSVTTVIRDAGLYDPSKYAPGAAERGQFVHVLTKLCDQGRLPDDWRDRYPEYVGYVDAWLLFLRNSGFKVTAIEERVTGVCNGTRYAGTLDRRGLLDGRRTILDLKTGAREGWHAIQTAAYDGTLEHRGRRIAVYLAADGAYRLVEHKATTDWYAFGNLLSGVTCERI